MTSIKKFKKMKCNFEPFLCYNRSVSEKRTNVNKLSESLCSNGFVFNTPK